MAKAFVVLQIVVLVISVLVLIGGALYMHDKEALESAEDSVGG